MLKSIKKIALVAVVLSTAVVGVSAQQSGADGLVLYRQGRYAEAVKVCEQDIAKNSANIDAYCVLCWSLVKNKQYIEAEQRATEARKINNSDVRLMEVLAEAKYYLGKNTGAMEMFQLYLSNVPANGARIGNAYYYMGEIYIRQGKYMHADIAMTTAVYTEPLVGNWWARCGYAREMAGSYDTALAAYNKALELNPSQGDAARGKARVQSHLQ